MAQRKRRGFTIVELVIVIAVIAILVGVLIPTFISVINKANVSSDTSLVKNINEALIAGEVTEGKPATMYEALQLAEKNGFSVEKLTPRSTGDIVWNSESNRFALVNGSDTVYSFNGEEIEKSAKIWKIVATAEEAEKNADYSSYIKGNAHYTSLSVKMGIDLGENTAESIVYTGDTAAKEIVIRTNHGETNIEVNGAKDTVKHYGTANLVKVVAVDPTNSYHEFGSVKTLEVASGHIVLENTSLVFELTKTEGANATFVSNGTVIKNTANAENVTVATTYDIYTLEQLCAFRDYVNAGMDFSNLPVEIKADIDMSDMKWLPIGTLQHPFAGTIHGGGHTISGLNPDEKVLNDDSWFFTTSSVKSTGSAFGLVGIAGNGSVSIDNLTLREVNIELSTGQCVGALIGFAANNKTLNEYGNTGVDNVYINNVVVYGKVSGKKDVGGIVGKIYNSGDLTVTNCVNNASVSAVDATTGKAGGIVGYICGQESTKDITIKLDNLTNNGDVFSAKDRVGGICSYVQMYHYEGKIAPHKTTIIITNCVNTGKIEQNGTDSYKGCAAGIVYDIYLSDNASKQRSIWGSATLSGCKNTGTIVGSNAQQITSTVSKTVEFAYDKSQNSGHNFVLDIQK